MNVALLTPIPRAQGPRSALPLRAARAARAARRWYPPPQQRVDGRNVCIA